MRQLGRLGPASLVVMRPYLVPVGLALENLDGFTLFDNIEYRVAATGAGVHFDIRLYHFDPTGLAIVCASKTEKIERQYGRWNAAEQQEDPGRAPGVAQQTPDWKQLCVHVISFS
jgi:hypothetical protein